MNLLAASSPRFLLAFVLSLLVLGASSHSYAQNQGRWYQVEVLIFKRNPLLVNSDELWRKDVNLAYPANTRFIGDTLAKTTHQLGGHNYTLRRDENYTVLFHESWRQQMWGKDRSASLIIRGGKTVGNHRELEGSIKLHIGRYLHISTDLWLSEFAYAEAPQGTNSGALPASHNEETRSWPRLPALPNASENYEYIFDNAPRPSQVITLREKRRMRSKETHYIDHPHMGILIRFLPLGE